MITNEKRQLQYVNIHRCVWIDVCVCVCELGPVYTGAHLEWRGVWLCLLTAGSLWTLSLPLPLVPQFLDKLLWCQQESQTTQAPALVQEPSPWPQEKPQPVPLPARSGHFPPAREGCPALPETSTTVIKQETFHIFLVCLHVISLDIWPQIFLGVVVRGSAIFLQVTIHVAILNDVDIHGSKYIYIYTSLSV